MKNNWQTKKLKTAILNEGKNNTFVNVSSEGFDIGIHDKGENTVVAGGKYTTNNLNRNWWEKTWFQIIALMAAVLGIISFFLIFIK